MRPSIRNACSILGSCAALLVGSQGRAIDAMDLKIDRLTEAGIRADGISISLHVPDQHHATATLHIASATLGGGMGPLRNLVVECRTLVARDFIYRCEGARITGQFAQAGRQEATGRLEWNQRTRHLKFTTAGWQLAGGRLDVEGQWREGSWQVHARGGSLDLARLAQVPGHRLPDLSGWSIAGQLASVDMQASSTRHDTALSIHARIEGVNIGNPDGTIATDQLAAQFSVDAHQLTDGWRFASTIQSTHGEALGGRWYWDFTRQPLDLGAGGVAGAEELRLEQARWQLGTFMRASAQAEVGFAKGFRIHALTLNITDLDMASLPVQTRDGLLAGSPVSQLQGAGHVSGTLEIRDDEPAAADLTLNGLTLEDRRARLGMDSLSGRIRWDDLSRRKQALESGDAVRSTLSWKSGLLYGVPVGAADLQFTTASRDFRLLGNARIPILDGGLDIRVLQLRRMGDPAMSIRFDATLDPISVAEMCKALGWPQFAGKLSGRIPDLTLESGMLTLGGALQASVFDGSLVVRDLRLSDALGARPRLLADVEFSRLDLEEITSAFDVGNITGRLDGRISGLELVGWAPVAFDAHLYSTPGDHSRRRISQRAVQNISSIGGGIGATAALQRSALRFFKDFSYDRIGISCQLKNDTCLMGGVEPHSSGFYLVKGRGLPRIDVIGNSRRVDWRRLVATLKELPESQATIGRSP